MIQVRYRSSEQGFTVSEVMVVVAIVGLLVSMAGISYTVFSDKAKTVEAETALVEVDRLEMMHHDARGSYSSDLEAIGYKDTPLLKYYTVEVDVVSGVLGVGYRSTAKPRGNSQLEPWVLTRYESGQVVLEKLGPTATADSTRGGGSSESSSSTGSSSDGSGSGLSGNGPGSKGTGTVLQTANGSFPAGGSISPSGSPPGASSLNLPSASR